MEQKELHGLLAANMRKPVIKGKRKKKKFRQTEITKVSDELTHTTNRIPYNDNPILH